jgi:hypothetical protein
VRIVIGDVTPCSLLYKFRRFEGNSLETSELTFHITLGHFQDDSTLRYLRKTVYSRNTQVFQKFRNHLEILGARRLTWSKHRSWGPTNIRCPDKESVLFGDLAPGIYDSQLHDELKQNKDEITVADLSLLLQNSPEKSYDGISLSLLLPNNVISEYDGAVSWCHYKFLVTCIWLMYMGADMSLARPTSRCILFDG